MDGQCQTSKPAVIERFWTTCCNLKDANLKKMIERHRGTSDNLNRKKPRRFRHSVTQNM